MKKALPNSTPTKRKTRSSRSKPKSTAEVVALPAAAPEDEWDSDHEGFAVEMAINSAGDVFDRDYEPKAYLYPVHASLSVDGLRVAVLTATLIRGDLMINEEQDLFTVLDDESQELSNLGMALFSGEKSEYPEQLEDTIGHEVLFVQKLTVEAGFRGHLLGLGLLRYVLRACPHSMAVLTPFPLQHSSSVGKDFPEFRKVSEKAGVAKLRAYYAQVGFERLGRTDYMVRDDAHIHDETPIEIDEAATRKLVTLARERKAKVT